MQKRLRRTRRRFVELERPRFAQTARQFAPFTSAELEDCLTQQSSAGGRLGEILCEHGLLGREQIFEVLSKQAEWVANSLQADMRPAALPYPAQLSLCLPAYNEEENIEDTVRSACAILPQFVKDFEIIVVDDGSQDGTSDIVCRLAEQDLRIRLQCHEQNGGYGAAVATGLRAARGDLVMFTDSDGQFNMLDLAQLLTHLANHDMVVGYRYPRADCWHRKFNAWSWNQLIQLTLGISVTDLDCAFKLFRREVVDRLNLTSTGACISAEIMAQCVRGGVHCAEVPVRHFPRYHGESTGANLKVILRAFRELPTLWHYRRRVKPLLEAEPVETKQASLPAELPVNQG